jgi:hypothetical protein
MIGFIYITTNTVTGKKYIGKKYYQYKGGKKSYWQSYLGSSKLLKEDIKRYGSLSFKREIIDEAETEGELALLEKYYIDKHNAVFSDEYYNLSNNVDKFFTTAASVERNLKTREKWTAEKRKAVSDKLKLSWASNYDERCKKSRGKRDEKFKQMRSEVQKKVIASMTTQQILERKEKLSIASKRHWNSLSEEQKQKHSAIRKNGLENARIKRKENARIERENFLSTIVTLKNLKDNTEQQMTVREVIDFGIPYPIMRAMVRGNWSVHNIYKRTWTITSI